jgi:SulP family sulfate permease
VGVRLPILRWREEMRQPGALRADLLAGLTGALVALPQGIAFATLAGLPPQYGLYCAMVPCLVAALFGSSRLMVTGPANAISLTTLALLAPLALPGSERYIMLALTLSFLVGLLQIALGVARLGRVVDLVPHSVIVGFTAGAAVLIGLSQIAPLLGLSVARGLHPIELLQALWHALPMMQPFAPLVGVVTLCAVIGLRRWDRFVPSMLSALVIGALCAWVLGQWGPAGWQPLRTVPQLPSAIPPFSAPTLDPDTLRQLLAPVLVMTLLALTEASAIARSVAMKHRDALDSSQEFIGQGMANVAGSFFSSYPASGSFNRSAVNMISGARTPRAAIAAAVFLALVVALVAPAARFLPFAVIAALLVIVAIRLIDVQEIRAIVGHGWREWVPMTVTCLFTIFVSLEWAILVGIVCALILRPARHAHD